MKAFKRISTFARGSLKRMVRAIGLRWAAGQALGGMMSNPEWMTWAKEEAKNHGRGDVPHQFALIAALYAERTMDMVEEREGNGSNGEVCQPRGEEKL